MSVINMRLLHNISFGTILCQIKHKFDVYSVICEDRDMRPKLGDMRITLSTLSSTSTLLTHANLFYSML